MIYVLSRRYSSFMELN